MEKQTITGMYEHLHSLEDEEKSDLMASNLYSALKLLARNRNRHLSTRLTCQIVSESILNGLKPKSAPIYQIGMPVMSEPFGIFFELVKLRVGTYSTRFACQIMSEPF